MTKTRIQLFLAATVLLATCLSVYAFTEIPHKSKDGKPTYSSEALIQGEGTYTDGTTTWTFAVNAVQKDGFAKGTLQWDQGNQHRSIAIDCLRFDGSIVYVSGKDSAAHPVTFVLYDSWESRRSDLVSSPIEGIGCGGDVYSASYSFNRLTSGKLHVMEP